MANTISAILPTIYDALDIVSRELVGFIPSVTRNSTAERAALNQPVTYPIAPAATTGDITPGTNPPDDGDQTITSDTITITKSKYSPVRWAGEEQVQLAGNYGTILRDQFAQSFRALVNLMEIDLWNEARKNASRAYGTVAQTPFGTASDLSDFANILRILEENGAPTNDLHLVLGHAAMSNLRAKQSVLFKVNEAGTAELLRNGVIGRVEGLNLHTSNAVIVVADGAGSAYQVNGAHAVGATTVAVDTGTGNINAGDIITIANGTPADSNKYVVNTGIAAAGNLVIGGPGLRSSHVDNDAVTLLADYTPNVAFARSALHLVTRAPAMPSGGDTADDVTEVTDPFSGLSFQVALYRQYRRVKYEVGIAWGQKASKDEHIAVLLG